MSGSRSEDRSHKQSSLIDLVQALKDQIAEKERLLKAKSQELIGERNFVENVVASMGDSVVVLDREAKISSVNPATEELLGYRAADLIGWPASRLWARPEQRAMFAPAPFGQLIAKGATTLTDMVYRTRHGEEVPVTWRGAPILSERNEVRGYVGIAHDLRTERRVQEARIKAVRAMAAGVAHEIRNPLGAIQNSVALLLRDTPLAGEDRELLEIVGEETQRISGIVNQFLRFARPAPLRLERGEVSGLIRDVVSLARRDDSFREEAHAIVVEVAEDVPEVWHDADKLKQVLWNLVRNALDALDGGGEVRVEARRVNAEDLELTVSDSGPGIPVEILSRIYEPFVTSKSRGTGLGLAIVRTIVEAHGGEMAVSTRAGQGTSFRLVFPAEGPRRVDGEAV